MSVRVRIAPSPTGDPHVGTAYMALFNMIFARHYNGTFILRIEDTDRARSRPEYEENIYSALKWANIQWDEGPDIGGAYGPYRQSERFDIYKQYAEELLSKGKAYKCFCTAAELDEMRELSAKQGGRQGYDRRCRHLTPDEIIEREQAELSYVIRLKVPLNGECVYEDAIKKRMTFPWADIDDQVLLKSDGFPTYHLANVVDDYLMKISHVIRGDEWMSSTPKHILLYESFGWTPPTFLHMPLLLGKDGKKLSKRKNPTSIFFYRDSGYLSEAFINFLTLMGYSMTGDQEIYSLDDIIREFDYKRIGVSGAIFDVQKLDWVNQQYLIKNIPVEQLWDRIKGWSFNDEFMQRLMPLCHSRIKTFGDFMDLFNFLFINHLHYNDAIFVVKDLSKEQICYLIQSLIWRLDELENWNGTGVNQASREIAEIFGVNHKKIVMPILFASLMSKTQGPPLFDSVNLLGKDRTRARLLKAMEYLGGISNKKMASLKKAWQEKSGQPLMIKD
ncbi:glutamate--tRNA ligase [Candidatus Protochlamydia amoebophila]|uniref:Glutamate--tRNA ligase n=1 Tax=Candidatus Protochlamydia amoebophila TaxID=362787 RepID=A0A0C1HGY9_9BACT|nr:glutamate--tRNA ligase [Candidatus Protochlamydia amoebophila]KIC73933.1 Glutamate--tRNA ligase [Candidatus Protochlamydia amoebophila]